jgi:hypothetical protein
VVIGLIQGIPILEFDVGQLVISTSLENPY